MSSNATFNAIVTAEMAADTRGDTFLTLAAQRLYVPAFGGLYTQAVCYLAASMMYNAPASNADATEVGAGPVTGRTAGKESITFGMANTTAAAIGDAALMNNPWGLQFIAIRDSRAARGPSVVLSSGLVPGVPPFPAGSTT